MDLSHLIRKCFDLALENGDLIFTPSTVSILLSNGINFEIRLAPSLKLKPKNQPQTKPFNPFLKPEKNLVVCEFENHCLLLNKFSITRDHLLLTTKEYQNQLEPLNVKDFESIIKVVESLQEKDLLFFYNCGSKSGFSVPHKHIQMLRCGSTGIPIKEAIERCAGQKDQIFHLKEFPFLHGIVKCSLLNATHLKVIYDTLMAYLYKKLNRKIHLITSGIEPEDFVSFNFLFFDEIMMIVPRSNEEFNLIGVNSVAFAGMLLAKTSSEFDIFNEFGPIEFLTKLTF